MAFFLENLKETLFFKKEDSNEYNQIKKSIRITKRKKDSMILNNSFFTSNNSKQMKAPFDVLSKKSYFHCFIL